MMNLNVYLTTYMKINSQWITDLNLRAKIIEFLENIGINLWDLELSNDFLDTTLKAQKTEEKNLTNLALLKLKTYAFQK